MWDPCSGERFPRSQSCFLPEVLEGLGRKRDPMRAQGGKANEYRLAVMNERHKGGIEGQFKKKSMAMVANRNITSTYFACFLL